MIDAFGFDEELSGVMQQIPKPLYDSPIGLELKLMSLDLNKYNDDLQQPSSGNRLQTLNDIRNELILPFKDYERSFEW